MKTDGIVHQRVLAARVGTNPTVIARMRSGWAVMDDRQVVRGYSLLLPDPVVPDLNALSGSLRAQFLDDMAALGDALLQATGASRINYEILGNSEPWLHAHLFPRYETEPPDLRRRPAWFYDWSTVPEFSRSDHEDFIQSVRSILGERAV
jgi:diadenosine tetraphosphate (Ap4A) HIT family hydrolase